MAFEFSLCVALLLSVWATAKCDVIPNGVLEMECHDRFFTIAVNLAFAGSESRFEAVDETGVYALTAPYAAQCGYSVSVCPVAGHVKLRASYFSCHTDDKDDEAFTFNFNLIVPHEGKEITYALNKTCLVFQPWSPREVTCEANYMEVSVKSDVACPTGTKTDDWDAVVNTAYNSATSHWQVMFQTQEQDSMPMSLSEAHDQGYQFTLTEGRLVFRAPYGQPYSMSSEVDGVPVEVAHATLFSRQNWVVLMVDLVAACSLHEGSYEDSGYLMLAMPVVHPLVSEHEIKVNIGVDGVLMEQTVAQDRGYHMERHNNTLWLSIPYNAEGGHRKSFVSGNLHEYYVFHLYLEQIAVHEGHVDPRLHFHRTLATPLLPRPIFTENRTVPEELEFTVYIGDIPQDVALTAVSLNGHEYKLQFLNTSSHSITAAMYRNKTHGYTLKVLFDDPVVMKQFSKEDGAMLHSLDINYTLTVLPEFEPFHQLASVMALSDVSPPAFEAVCSESGISFRLDHRPFDHLWELRIGSDMLTPELAAQHGYIMRNDSRSLLLEVPLFSHGYEYKDITLTGFSGTFEILVRDPETSEVQSSAVKTCPFSSSEIIMCSTDGRMTVVADLSLALTSGGVPARTNLLDKYCGPKEADDTRALFSFPLNSCGSTVKLGKEYVTYENEIFFSKLRAQKNQAASTYTDRVTIQCTYPLSGLHRLFSVYKFDSDTAGVGHIEHSALSTQRPQTPTLQPTTVLQTRLPANRRTPRPVSIRPGYHPPAQYIKVSSFLQNLPKKGAKGPSQTQVHATIF